MFSQKLHEKVCPKENRLASWEFEFLAFYSSEILKFALKPHNLYHQIKLVNAIFAYWVGGHFVVMTKMQLPHYEELSCESLQELETLQVENELVTNRQSNDLLQIREYRHEDSVKGWTLTYRHDHFSGRLQLLSSKFEKPTRWKVLKKGKNIYDYFKSCC